MPPDTVDAPSGEITIGRAAISSLRGRHVAALEVTRNHNGNAIDSEEIECILSAAAVSYLTPHLGIQRNDVMWVGRYSLDSEQPEGWLSPGTLTSTLHTGHRLTIGSPQISVGWGNGSVVGWATLAEPDRNQIVRGLVDAQCIWAECHAIAARALASFNQAQDTSEGLNASKLKDQQRAAEGLSTELVSHHLAVDDLLLNIQGVRSEAARTALDAWGYDAVSARVVRRVEDLKGLLQLRRERFERRFQSTVEYILFAVALLSLIQFALSLIATAFTGPVSTSPGIGSALGIFTWLRSTNADILVLASVALAVVTAVLVEKRRRR